MKIAIVNGDVYRITNRDFERISAVFRIDTKKGKRRHDRNCEHIQNRYEPIYISDVVIRND